MNLHGYEYEYRIFSWIISVDISVHLKIYGYEYEYAKFLWILSLGSPILFVNNICGYMLGFVDFHEYIYKISSWTTVTYMKGKKKKTRQEHVTIPYAPKPPVDAVAWKLGAYK